MMTLNWNNLSTIHHRWMMRYLQKRGWVVFYLDERCRFCPHFDPPQMDGCWLKLYEQSCGRGGS